MHKLFPMILAGIIGGLIVMAGSYLYKPEINSLDASIAAPVNFKTEIASVPLDFTEAAMISMSSVVHITALESEDLAQQRLEDNRERIPEPVLLFLWRG